MAARIDILTSGYATLVTPEATGTTAELGRRQHMKATGSCCLVRSGQTNILFDTMGPWEKDLLIDRLKCLRIHPDDIEYLVCSHSHPDHIGNINLFTKAKKHFVGTSVYTADLYDLNCFEPIGSYTYKSNRTGTETEVIKYQHFQLDSNLSIEPTPGHTMECVSLLVSNCETYGVVALAGDLFERAEDVQDESIWIGAGSQNADLQRASRCRIYNKVNHILPGHGHLFRTLQDQRVTF